MSRIIVFLILASCLLVSCNQLSTEKSGQPYSITGSVHSMKTGSVYLMKEDGGVGKVIDTSVVDDSGNFVMNGKADEPGLYTLDMNDQLVSFVLDTSTIRVTAQGIPEGRSIVHGSRIQKNWDAFDHALFDYRLRMALLKKSSMMAEEKEKKANNYYTVFSNKTKQLIKSSGSSFLSLILASKLDVEKDFPMMDSLYNVFSKELPGSSYTVDYRYNIDRVRCTVIGQNACEISLTDNKGVLRNLSDLKGKYVLLDFWASWCGPCRQENPNLVKLYSVYAPKGFEIYSVSIDESKDAWIQAIKEDNLAWPQVSDLKGWEGSTAVKYNVDAIPTNFLLDKEGKIIYKNLEAKQLEMILDKIFKK